MFAFKGEDGLSTLLRGGEVYQDCCHPLAWLRPIAFRIKHIIVRVIMLSQLISQYIERLQAHNMSSASRRQHN